MNKKIKIKFSYYLPMYCCCFNGGSRFFLALYIMNLNSATQIHNSELTMDS